MGKQSPFYQAFLGRVNETNKKGVVFFNNGGTEYSGDILSYDREVLERAKEENVRIYTVALGDSAVTDNLEEIADVTDGAAFAYTYNSASAIADAVFAHQAYLKKLRRRAPLFSLSLINIGSYSILCGAKVRLMMNDYDAYSEHSNPDDISDEMWDAYCTEFNEAVLGTGVFSSDVHYFRNKLNRALATRDELIDEKEKWELLSVGASRYHMYGEDGLFNTKFVSRGDGRYEGVYDKDGLLLTEENDSKNMGTYNYGDPNNFILHGFLDVLTYDRWGNVKGVEHEEEPRSMKDFYANQEAQDAYNKIKEQMESK